MDFDLIVVGGGPVGMALARAASGAQRVALVAQERPAAAPPAALDARVYALSPGNVAFLSALGAWQAIDPARVAPVRAMIVQGDRPGARIEFDAYRAGAGELAWTVEDTVLQAALWRSLEGRERLEVLAPAQCESLELGARQAELRLRDGRRLRAALVAGADGANSFVRSQAGIEARRFEYEQAALVANFECELPHEETARQWFQGGPVLALLPLAGRRVSLIWSLPAQEAARLEQLAPPALCGEVERASGGALGALMPLTAPRSYPLRRLAARRLVARRVALVGDAAHVIHPLAGQGLNLGLQDARALAAALAGRAPVLDAGDPLVLRRYERCRAEPILAMDVTVDGLFRLFGAPAESAAALRNWGLNLTDRLPVIKNLLIRHAMA